jgi:methyl-accepting chemotaxis protein
MKWFYDLKIAYKMAVTFVIVLLLTSVLGIFSISQLSRVDKSATDMSDYYVPTLRNTLLLQIITLRISGAHQQLAQEQATGIPTDTRAQIEEQIKQAQSIIAELHSALRTQAGKAFLETVEERFNTLVVAHNDAMKAIDDQKIYEGIEILMNQTPELTKVLLDATKEFSNNMYDRAADIKAASTATYQSALGLITGILIFTFAASILLAFFISRSISKPLQVASQVADRVAGGDLTVDIASTSKDETGQLMHALKVMNDGLLKVVSQIRQGSDTINTAASEIAAGNMDLSSRTEEQASSLEETASAMEELTSTVKQNADNAKQANQLASSASQIAIAGGDVVDKVVHTMNDINASSRKIVDIITVIDGIAFQTNILALNAAVEAARAGEQGRGFAVVASEVRSLAQRSASAAKEIKELIDDSVSKVDIGSKLVEEAGTTMHDVVESIRRVTDIVAEISAASQEQSTGIEEINRAITQMDETTQQNAALVEQATAATQSLQVQANELGVAVNSFKIDQSQATYVASPVKKSVPKSIIKKATPAVQPAPAALTSPARQPAQKTRTPATTNDNDSWEEF